MRFSKPVAIALTTVALLPFHARAQEPTTPREILSAVEFAYPSASAPTPFGQDSAASAHAAEIDDRRWSSGMEALILEEIERERDQGLRVRRTDVECRTSTCVVLLVHAISGDPEVSIDDLIESLRQNLGFADVSRAEKLIPLAFTDATDPARPMTHTMFVSGYVEIVLLGGRNTSLQARQGDR